MLNLTCYKIYTKFIEFLKRIKFIIDGHIFLSIANLISLVIAILPALYILFSYEVENKYYCLAFLMPFLIVYLISQISCFIAKKFKFISAFLSFISIAYIVFIVQISIGFLFFIICHGLNIETKSNKIQNYQFALEQIEHQDFIKHFPKVIPINAQNAKIYTNTMSFFGSECLYLKFNINDEYIENELKKYKYIKIEPFEKTKNEYTFNQNIGLDNSILYIINDKEHEKLPEKYFSYHYGIAVNKNKSQIIYYYEDPD